MTYNESNRSMKKLNHKDVYKIVGSPGKGIGKVIRVLDITFLKMSGNNMNRK